MNIIPLLLFLVFAGCATPTAELMQEAKDCVAGYHDERGVLLDAPAAYKTECWLSVNNRLKSAERRRKKEEVNTCPSGYIMWCYNRRCQCVTRGAARRALEGLRY